jgi:hypothetical protein
LKKRILIILLLLLSLIIIGWYSSGKPLHNYLSIQNPCEKADVLIAEGWLEHNQLNYVAQHFKSGKYKYLITTGYPVKRDLLMYKNGTYYLKINHPIPEGLKLNLELELQGTLPYIYASVFKVYVNKDLIACDSVGKLPKKFSYNLFHKDSIESVSIKFTNDAIIEGQDRNLIVTSVRINNHFYSAYDSNATYTIQTSDDSTVFNLAGTQALLARNLLLRRGIPEKYVIAISGQKPGISKTLSTAGYTKNAIDSILGTGDYNLNIISIPPHTRRTHAAFNKYHPKESVGIIAVPDSYIKDLQVNRFENIRELLGILFIKLHPGT